MRQSDATTPTSEAVKRALTILECLDSSRRGLNISELSRRLNLPKSSTHVIVLTLEKLGYLEKQPDGILYSLGLKSYLLGQGIVQTLHLADTAEPYMKALAKDLHLAVHLAVPDKDQGVFIQKVSAPGSIELDTYVGRRMDLHCTGVGKVILAFGPADIRDHMLSKKIYMRHTEKTITNPRMLTQEIHQVRKSGYAVDDEEEELGIRCVAVPIYDDAQRFLAALSVSGSLRQVSIDSIERIFRQLQSTAVQISHPQKGKVC